MNIYYTAVLACLRAAKPSPHRVATRPQLTITITPTNSHVPFVVSLGLQFPSALHHIHNVGRTALGTRQGGDGVHWQPR
jgi:hypothetical protein